MITTLTVTRTVRRTRNLSVAVIMLAVCLRGAPASAEELFDFDPGRWMSSQRYSDKLKNAKPEEAEAPVVSPPELAQEAAKVEPPKPESPEAKLLKSYSYSPPPMPGMNNGFTMRITSTDDPDKAEKPPSTPTTIPTTEDEKTKELALPDNWKSPASMAQSNRNDEDAENEKPLNVRMSVLPTPSATPAPVAKQESKRARAQAKKPEKTKEQIAQEKAACDAFENFKKQQIDAIQSDRQTLKALQDAVHSLGLAKKMDFRPDNGSVLLDSEHNTGPLVPRGTPIPKGR